LGDLSGLTEKVATLVLNLYTVEKQRKKSAFTTFLREMIGRPKLSKKINTGYTLNNDVSSMRYLGELPSLEEKVATLALNLYTVRKQRNGTLLYNFFKKIYWSKNLGTGKM
jgi:hypothetical protein